MVELSIAEQEGVTIESMRMALRDFKPEGYERVRDRLFVSNSRLREIDEKLRGVEMLKDALRMIKDCGLRGGRGRRRCGAGYPRLHISLGGDGHG